jgi:hypothetical protein
MPYRQWCGEAVSLPEAVSARDRTACLQGSRNRSDGPEWPRRRLSFPGGAALRISHRPSGDIGTQRPARELQGVAPTRPFSHCAGLIGSQIWRHGEFDQGRRSDRGSPKRAESIHSQPRPHAHLPASHGGAGALSNQPGLGVDLTTTLITRPPPPLAPARLPRRRHGARAG